MVTLSDNVIPFPNSTKSMLLAQELDDYQIAEMESHPRYAEIVAGQLPDGSMIKITGHLRGFLWHTGRAKPPLNVKVIDLGTMTMEKALEHYDVFNGEDGWPRLWMTEAWDDKRKQFGHLTFD